jgi:hypothetical protein
MNNEHDDVVYDNTAVEAYGIAFPKSMLPLASTSGRWESEPLLDLEGTEDEEFIRIWIYEDE